MSPVNPIVFQDASFRPPEDNSDRRVKYAETQKDCDCQEGLVGTDACRAHNSVQKLYGQLTWWVKVISFTQATTGKRWCLCYDDIWIKDFDHEPTMNECMEALIKWWNS